MSIAQEPGHAQGHHHEPGHERDPHRQKVGLLAACIAVALAIVTIASHRAHTGAVAQLAEANDQWSLYQAKRLKSHTAELGRDMLTVLRPDGAVAVIQRYSQEIEKNDKESKDVSEAARNIKLESALSERQALRYDLGEAMLEVGLVLCSIYFISKRRIFPPMGVAVALLGAGIALTGLLMRVMRRPPEPTSSVPRTAN